MASQRILEPPAVAAVFLVLTVRPGGEQDATDLLGDLDGVIRTVGFRHPDARLSCVVGIGSDFYDRVYDGARPAGLHPFIALNGPKHHAPSTPGDLLLHVRARRADMCFELCDIILRQLGDAVAIADETHAFRYFDDRDLLGFVDGTESPEDDEAVEAAIVGDEDPDFAGSSYVIVQKYTHEMEQWRATSVEEQEQIIGRTKLENIELDDDVKPQDSHVALNTITDPDGTERDIVRHNLAFASFDPPEQGTYFIGYAADPAVTEQMLVNMFIGNPPGLTDRILEFSTAQTGSLFFVPTLDFLGDQPLKPEYAAESDEGPEPPPEDPSDRPAVGPSGQNSVGSPESCTTIDPSEDPSEHATEHANGSLGIGSLKRRN